LPIYYPDILEEEYEPQTFSYGDKDVMLYALGVGMGADPLDQRELPFVYERNLRTVPTAATVLASYGDIEGFRPRPNLPPGRRLSTPNMLLLVHGEQKLELHKPLPGEGTFTARARMMGAWDKGPKTGAIVYMQTHWTDAAGELAATLTTGLFFRGDGGFGGPTDGEPQPHPTPSRAPDLTLEIATRPDQALLYRLCGDRTPLHSDPEIARRAGFERPILHGLCTYGITCRAVLAAWCDFDPDRIESHEVRFSRPVFPGDVITVDMWRDANVISFEAHVAARGVTVIKHGKTVLRG
jgi:acyl dehydratase